MFKIEFETANAAFDDGNDGRDQISEILHYLADAVEGGLSAGPVRDSNGNTVGVWSLDT